MNNDLSRFAARLSAVIADCSRLAGRIGDCRFDELAHELFDLQYQHNPAYRRICEVRNARPQTVEHWTRIPGVPTAAFKELDLTSIPAAERTAVFHSSGTTEQKPSRHFHCPVSLALYEASLWCSWKCRLPVGDGRLIALTPSPAQAPHSSLVHMFETIRQKSGAPEELFFGKISDEGGWTLNFEATLNALQSAIANRQSAIIIGTAFSFVHLLDFLAEKKIRFRLPSGSRVMETGGYKNRSRSMPKAELHALITGFLGVPEEDIICEYGMSELSSQAYDGMAGDEWRVARNGLSHRSTPVTRHFYFPAWARVQVVSPETGREAGEGETGLIRIFDLANVFSVAAIQTEDLGIRRGDGFELVGRAQLAEPRGCSLMTA